MVLVNFVSRFCSAYAEASLWSLSARFFLPSLCADFTSLIPPKFSLPTWLCTRQCLASLTGLVQIESFGGFAVPAASKCHIAEGCL